MNINTTYGSMQTPSENSDVVGNAGSPGGVNSSLIGYAKVQAALIGTTYIAPSSTLFANAVPTNVSNPSWNIGRRESLQVWNGNKSNWAPSSFYGGNL